MVIQKFSHARVYEWFVGTKVENKDVCVLCEKVRDISQIGSENKRGSIPFKHETVQQPKSTVLLCCSPCQRQTTPPMASHTFTSRLTKSMIYL